MKSFKPFLAPNDVIGKNIDIDTINGQYFVSPKLDGCRIIFKDGEMLSRSLKQIPNVKLHEKFAHLKEWSKTHNRILDGELYDHHATFQEIISYVMTQDKEVPDTLKFYCFDTLNLNNPDESFFLRIASIPLQKGLIKLEQEEVKLPEESQKVKEIFQKKLQEDYEGLILKHCSCPYKYGRGTIKEGYVFKYKAFETHDAKIIEVIQATEVRKGAEKKINELGNSVTSKKKADRILIDKASAFMVDFNGLRFKVSIAENDEEKKKIWEERDKYIDNWVEFEAMFVGVKTNPRHPITKRMRWEGKE